MEREVSNSRSRRVRSDGRVRSSKRLLLGIFILFIVNIIWVASSELSKYLFHDENYDKPFYSTYIKTSMFMIFLLGFIFWTPWQDRCCFPNNRYPYSLVNNQDLNGDNGNRESSVMDDDPIDDNDSEANLSAPAFVPINYEQGSGTESDEIGHNRSVRFSKLAEVRQMSDTEAAEALFSRLSYEASVQIEHLSSTLSKKLTPSETAQLALTFCFMWFVANYTYQLALSNTEAGIVNILSSVSGLFTLMLASLFPSIPADRFTLSKFLTVIVSLSGVTMVSVSDLRMEENSFPLGALFALISAFFYAMYLVFLRKKVSEKETLDIPMFFGFVGLFNFLMLWPFFYVLNYAGVETFSWPNKRQWLFLFVNGMVGTVLSEILWLWGCFLTSSLIATLAISLTIPMSMLADVLFKKVSYSFIFYIGCIPILLSFLGLTFLTHREDWDPVMDFMRECFKSLRFRRHHHVYLGESDQTRGLIENEETSILDSECISDTLDT